MLGRRAAVRSLSGRGRLESTCKEAVPAGTSEARFSGDWTWLCFETRSRYKSAADFEWRSRRAGTCRARVSEMDHVAGEPTRG